MKHKTVVKHKNTACLFTKHRATTRMEGTSELDYHLSRYSKHLTECKEWGHLKLDHTADCPTPTQINTEPARIPKHFRPGTVVLLISYSFF